MTMKPVPPGGHPLGSKFFRVAWLVTSWLPSWRGSKFRVWLLRREGATIGEGVRIGPLSRVHGPAGVVMHDRVALARNVFVDGRGGIEIGRESLIGFDTVLSTYGHRFEDAETAVHDQGFEPEGITIGEQVWIGARVFVVPGTAIGDGSIVGTMALVTKDVPAKVVVGGVPAKVLRER